MFVRLIKILLSTFIFHIQPLSYLRFIHYKENGRTDKSIWLSFVHISFINIILNAKKCLSSWIGICTVSTGIEPAISCVTGRRVNRYTTRPIKLKTMYCGRRIWTTDLRVMSPTSYRTAPSRANIILNYLINIP